MSMLACSLSWQSWFVCSVRKVLEHDRTLFLLNVKNMSASQLTHNYWNSANPKFKLIQAIYLSFNALQKSFNMIRAFVQFKLFGLPGKACMKWLIWGRPKECILKVHLSLILKLFCMFSHMTLEDTIYSHIIKTEYANKECDALSSAKCNLAVFGHLCTLFL